MKNAFIKFAFVFCFLLLNFEFTNAQWFNPNKVNSKAVDLYLKALDAASQGDNKDAIIGIDKALKIEPKYVDAYLLLAGIYSSSKDYPNAIAQYQKGMGLDSIYAETFNMPYSIALSGAGEFQKALDAIDIFLRLPNLNPYNTKNAEACKATYEFAIDYSIKHPNKDYVFIAKNMGDAINTTEAEYYPSLTIDGTKLVFTRRIGDRDEDFYQSELVNGKWTKAVPLTGKVNTSFNEGAQNVSQDGTLMIFAGCNYPEGFGSCDLYSSYKSPAGWSEPANLGPVVNSDAWESAPSLSPDKRDLYFTSDHNGGFGGKDIWVTHRLPNGSWSDPQNLGPVINTGGDESCPFMHADNQTLFFNSNGHPGYGGTDLYYTKKINDSTWSTPVNLGFPINTIDNEGSLIVAADGKTAYYASDRSDSKGDLDLYSFELREDIRPARTLWVKGKVYDIKTKAGLPSAVELTDINTKQIVSMVKTDDDGNFLTTLPVGKDYAFEVNKKGYLFFSQNYDLSKQEDSVFNTDIPLQPLEAGARIVLKNIFFDSKQATLKPASLTELDRVVQLMIDNPNLKIQINGFTDNIGKDSDNILLSNNRAAAVVQYLLASKQIAKDRLLSKGFGAADPIADNATDEGRALNRRTELSVISN